MSTPGSSGPGYFFCLILKNVLTFAKSGACYKHQQGEQKQQATAGSKKTMKHFTPEELYEIAVDEYRTEEEARAELRALAAEEKALMD